jgi:hypothetical protein
MCSITSDPLAARDDADTIEGNDTNELVTASIAHSVPHAEPGNGKSFDVWSSREARVRLLSR